MTGWTKSAPTRRYICRYCGDLTERLSSYSQQLDISYCPNDGTSLVVQVVGGDNMTKKLKVMTEIPKLREAKGEAKAEVKPDKVKKAKEAKKQTATSVLNEKEASAELERAFEALRKLGGKATSPELVKELGFEGETARDKVRRLMRRLHDAHRIHMTHEGKKYVFEIAEPKAEAKVEPAVEVATA